MPKQDLKRPCSVRLLRKNERTKHFFISNAWLKLAKNQANAKQHLQATLYAI